MNTYYSILFSPIRSAIKEQISIALLLIDDTKMKFDFSNEKVNFLRKLIPIEAVNLIKQYVGGISKEIVEFNESQKETGEMFKESASDYTHFSEKYLSYLNSFNNNLIQFSKPKRIDIDVSDESFKLLFEKFVSINFTENLDNLSISRIIKAKKQLYPRIEKRVNLDFETENIELPVTDKPRFFPSKINILGKNGKYFSAQFIDFEKRVDYLKSDLSFYSNFINEIDDGGKNYIIGNEPDRLTEKKHDYWSEMNDYSKISLIKVDEIEEIENYIIQNDVKPYTI